MIFTESRHSTHRRWKIKTWRCCGLVWQLIVTPKFHDRDSWDPVCPSCGSTWSLADRFPPEWKEIVFQIESGEAEGNLPSPPWKLNEWTTITDTARWLEWLKEDLRRGTKGARWSNGTMQRDLLSLQTVLCKQAGKDYGF